MMRLIVNLPAFNEAKNIGATIKRIPRHFRGVDEVLVQVVNDGSKDETAKVSTEAGADFVITHEVNRGIGVTFRTAVEQALERGADILVNMDSDGQFDPQDIQKLIDPILAGESDMVSASRFGDKAAKDMPKVKYWLNRFAANLIGSFMNYPIDDLTCGFRAYNRETMLRLNLPGEFTYTQEVIIDAIGKRLKVSWVPVIVTYFAGRKSRVVKSIFSYVNNSFRIILKAVRDVRPMKFFGGPGLILTGVSFLIFAYFAFHYFQEFKITPYRNILLLGVTLLLVGLQFLIFALIADMIKTNRKLTEDQFYLMRKEKYKK